MKTEIESIMISGYKFVLEIYGVPFGQGVLYTVKAFSGMVIYDTMTGFTDERDARFLMIEKIQWTFKR